MGEKRGPKEGFHSVQGALKGHSGENVTIIRKSYDFANILVGVGHSLLFLTRGFFSRIHKIIRFSYDGLTKCHQNRMILRPDHIRVTISYDFGMMELPVNVSTKTL